VVQFFQAMLRQETSRLSCAGTGSHELLDHRLSRTTAEARHAERIFVTRPTYNMTKVNVSGRCQRRGTLRVSVVAGVCPMPRQSSTVTCRCPSRRDAATAPVPNTGTRAPCAGLDLNDASRQLIRPGKPYPAPFAKCCCRQSQRPRCGPGNRRFT
jgi:hypothetical protein